MTHKTCSVLDQQTFDSNMVSFLDSAVRSKVSTDFQINRLQDLLSDLVSNDLELQNCFLESIVDLVNLNNLLLNSTSTIMLKAHLALCESSELELA